MAEIIEHGDSGNDKLVEVGDSNSQVSLKIYQDVYHQVTGRTEQIRKRYSDNLLVTFSEVEQLHHKILQLCDVHKVVARNENVSVFHSKERKEQFTSFERFKSYNANTSSPTINVVLKYNFSIIPAGLNRPQEYTITARLTSRIAVIEDVASEAPPFIRGRFFGFAAHNTAEVSVEYADYVIARGFLEAFDEWVRGCNSEADPVIIKFAQRNSYLMPKLLKALAAVAASYFSIEAIAGMDLAVLDIPFALRFITIFAAVFYLLVGCAGFVGSLIEDAIDSHVVISYLKLNKGDEKLIGNFNKQRNGVIRKFILGCVLTVALGVLSSRISMLI